jgi:hypothetical protein
MKIGLDIRQRMIDYYWLWRLVTDILPYRKYPDHCQICRGKNGGVRGNENIVNNIIMCDYCSIKYHDK